MILVVDMSAREGSLAREEYARPIAESVGGEIVHYRQLTAPMVAEASHIVLCGTPLRDNVVLDDIKRFAWLARIEKPVLGICVGAEVIGQVFGCELESAKEIGVVKVRVEATNPLADEDFEAYCVHSQAVVPNDQVEVFARSDACVQMFRIVRRPVWGIQFHPEVRNLQILQAFLHIS